MRRNATSEEDRVLPLEPSGSHGMRPFRTFWALRFAIVGVCVAGLAVTAWGKDDLRGTGMMLAFAVMLFCIARLFVLANRTPEPPDAPPWQPPPDP